MANLFFRSNIAPYRIDTYNALHEKLGCEFYFFNKKVGGQKFDMQKLYDLCNFKPNFLKSISIFSKRQKFCTNIWSILRKENPEIVIVPEFKILTIQVLLYRWLFGKKIKVVSMCDDSYAMVANSKNSSFFHRLARKIIVPSFDEMLLVDSRVVDWYRNHYNKGIWLPIIRDEKTEILAYQRVLPLSEKYVNLYGLKNKKVLLFLARLVTVKNIDGMLDAISKTSEEFITVIVGSGPYEEQFKQHALKIHKPIQFVGSFEGDSVRAWYNVADAFILPSTWEPFGAVTNEALIAGVPCIISEMAGSLCLINDNNGISINPFDIDNMALSIDKVMKSVKLRDNVTTRSCKMSFTFDETIDRVIKELRK